MTSDKFVWLLSLGSVSYVGPVFSMLKKAQLAHFDTLRDETLIPCRYISGLDKPRGSVTRRIDFFNNTLFRCDDNYDYYSTVNKLCKEDNFLKKMLKEKVLTGCILSDESIKQLEKDKMNKVADLYKTCKQYEHLIKEESYYAYSLANAIALIRVAVYYNKMNAQIAMDLLKEVEACVIKYFDSYESFGMQATIIRKIHVCLLKTYKDSFTIKTETNRYSHVIYKEWYKLRWAGDPDDL